MAGYKQMKCLELKKLLDGDIVLVDIRREDEWELTGVVEGSLLLTFFDQAGNSDPAGWMWQLDQQQPIDKPLALICRSGYRTGLVCDFLCQASKRAKIYSVTGGILDWISADLPVVQITDCR